MKKNSLTKDEVVETATEPKTAMIKVLAQWKSFTPDCRPYKPSTPVIEFPEPLIIAIDVPLTSDLIKNAGVIAAAQLTNQAEPKTHFTPLGMRYIIDQFESAMKNGKDAELLVPASDEVWEDEPEKAVETKPTKSDDEEWEDEDTTKPNKEDDAPWNEDWDEDK